MKLLFAAFFALTAHQALAAPTITDHAFKFEKHAGGKDPARFAAHGASASASRESFGDAIAGVRARSCVSPSPTGIGGTSRKSREKTVFIRRTDMTYDGRTEESGSILPSHQPTTSS